MALIHDTALTRTIIGLAMRGHSVLGPGLLESAYEHCLCHELEHAGLPHERQVGLPLRYGNTLLPAAYRADVIVARTVLLELKAVEAITPLHEAQLLTYLRMSGCDVGLLLNFNTARLTDGLRRMEA